MTDTRTAAALALLLALGLGCAGEDIDVFDTSGEKDDSVADYYDKIVLKPRQPLVPVQGAEGMVLEGNGTATYYEKGDDQWQSDQSRAEFEVDSYLINSAGRVVNLEIEGDLASLTHHAMGIWWRIDDDDDWKRIEIKTYHNGWNHFFDSFEFRPYAELDGEPLPPQLKINGSVSDSHDIEDWDTLALLDYCVPGSCSDPAQNNRQFRVVGLPFDRAWLVALTVGFPEEYSYSINALCTTTDYREESCR